MCRRQVLRQAENQDLKDKLLVKNQPTVKRKLQAKGKVVKRKFDENTSKMSDSIELVKQEASANAEVLKNVSNDIMHQTMDAFKACKSNSNSIIDKTKAVDVETDYLALLLVNIYFALRGD